jgi:hypothetical protein
MAAVADTGGGKGTATHTAGAKAAPRVEASLACTAFTLSTSLMEGGVMRRCEIEREKEGEGRGVR